MHYSVLMSAAFAESLLSGLGVTDEDTLEYLCSFLEDEGESTDSVVEACKEFLEASLVRASIRLSPFLADGVPRARMLI